MESDYSQGRDALQDLVREEIRRVIADALERDEMLHVGAAADRLARTYGAHGLSAAFIADQLVRAGVSAGITMEMSRPKS